MWRVNQLASITLVFFCLSINVFAQQPSPTPAPERTGRSYSTPDLPKNPPPPGPQARSPLTFADISTHSGINFRHAASKTSRKYLLETMGGGVAVFDFDNDGRMDLFFTNGAALKDPMPKEELPDKSQPKYWNRLFQQKPDGTFTDVTERAGVRGVGYSMGVAAADYDNDRYVDLFVSGYKADRLYRNNGDGTFSDVTSKLPSFPAGWSTSAGWFDYDRDGRLDLFIARYMDWDFDNGATFCGGPTTVLRAYCHPDNFKGAANVLLRQRAGGSFEDVSKSSGIADPSGKGLGVAFADFDNDGWTDVFFANDSVRQSLYRNKENGSFEDIAVMSGAAYDEDGRTFAGMGIDCGDYDNDGYMDVFITTLSNEKYAFYRNNGDLSFTYATNTSAVGQITLLYSGWGARFVDIDNDGQVDAVIAVLEDAPVILRNQGTANHWLGLTLAGSKSNRSAIGARVTVTSLTGQKQIFDVSAAGSYLSSNDPRLVVGLGGSRGVRSVEVRWPSGRTQTISNPGVDKYLRIDEPQITRIALGIG
ncbi:MAG TPA: CRTAC1 family protein [Pyrinomonadaceae bacterium]|nr:CRTAC1 family protein [Pyrinomonadaceae bacterium]